MELIKEYRYIGVGRDKWKETGVVKPDASSETPRMRLGNEAFIYLRDLELFEELKLILQQKVDQLKVIDSMDIYIDENSQGCLLNILFFDDDGYQVAEPFSVEIFTKADGVRFAVYTFEPMFNEINMFYVASYQRCKDIGELDEHYEIGEYVQPKNRYHR